MDDISEFLKQRFGSAVESAKETVSGAGDTITSFLQQKFGASNTSPSPSTQQAPTASPTRITAADLMPKLVQAESRGKHMDEKGNLTRSPVGAEGITQLMPKTAANPGFGIEPVKDKSESEYMRVGTQYLDKLLNKYGGDAQKALAAYNWGTGNVDKSVGKAERFGGHWTDALPKETREYIKKIFPKRTESDMVGKDNSYLGIRG